MDQERKQPTAAEVAREIRAQEAAEKKQKAAEKNKQAGQGCLIFIAIIAVVGIIIWATSGSNDSSTSSSTPEQVVTLPNGDTVNDTLANVLCRDQIRDQLRAPSTAEFPNPFSSDYTRPTKSGNTWRNTIRVDAQNAFGAMVRSQWFCEINGDTGVITVREQ